MIDDGLIIQANGVINSEGKLKLYNQEIVLEAIKSKPKTNIEFTIRTPRGITHPIRSYYFKVVVTELQKAFYNVGYDYSKDDVDYIMRDKFLYYEEYDEKIDRYIKSIHTLRDSETQVTFKMFKEYIQQCIIFAATWLDWAIPMVNEKLTRDDLTESQVNYFINN